ncbi:hypothetical protein Tco_1222465, partial [Tanacetum coccineum]
QWSPKDRRLTNQDKRLKSIIISCLPNDVMKSVIKCATAKSMWNDLILSHEGPSDTRDTKITALSLKFNAFKALKAEKVKETFTRLKILLNKLENKGVIIPQAEVNATFVNSLPKKWLSMNQTQRANNSIKNDSLATLFGKYNYKEELIDQIYESETQRFTIQSSTSKALISNTCIQDSDSDVEEDTMSNNEFLADLNVEFHDRAILANQKRIYKRSGRVGGKYKALKAELAILTKKIDVMSKNKSEKGLVAKSFDWDEESLSSKDEGLTMVKAFMAIAKDEPAVGKADARYGQWAEITMKKVQRLISMTDGDEKKHVLDYINVDLHYVEDQRKNLLNKFNSLKQELSSRKYELIDLKNTKIHKISFQHEISRLNLDNESLRDEVSDLKKSENSSFENAPDITSDIEFDCDNHEPLPLLPKLSGAKPIGTSKDVIPPIASV